MKPEDFISEFCDQCIYRIDENTKKIKACLEQLTEHEVWERPNEYSNSAGNLLLHLCGNIKQYAISSLGDKEDNRERDKEFSAREGFSKSELSEKLIATIEEANNAFMPVQRKRY